MTTLTLSFAGKARYITDLNENHHRLLIGVRCKIGELKPSFNALLDTGSQWCVLRRDVAEALGCDPTPGPEAVNMDTRFGVMRGRLERIPIRFEADDGNQLEVDTTSFIAAEWPGPIVIGWRGCLERIRIALDPASDIFYFGSQE